CHWETYIYYTPCACHPGHYDASECTCPKGKPKQYVLTWNVCEEVEDTAPGGGAATPGNSPGGGSTDPNTGIIPNQPCGGNGVPSQPQDPNATLGTNEGCNSGTPTLPNLEPIEFEELKTDCERLKEKTDDALFKHRMDSLKLRVTQQNPDPHETSITVEKYKGKITYSIAQSPPYFQADGTKSVINTQSNHDVAGLHNHCPGGIPIFSYPDLVSFYDHYKFLVPFRKNEFSMFLVTFKGTSYALRMQDITVLDTLFQGMDLNTKEGKKLAEKKVREIYETYGGLNTNQTYTVDMAEKMLMKVLNTEKFGNGNSVFLYQYIDNQWKKLTLNPDGTIQKIPCP
ncbi:hypothetical protein AB4Y90_10770, partial [Chryseobacterium sp. 2TAF14]|uniref:hypothetical protein n=1 Tax=Chryseobacterium sp. 2TAF14 TaxID=3233007 RepID=UPI003F8EC3C9